MQRLSFLKTTATLGLVGVVSFSQAVGITDAFYSLSLKPSTEAGPLVNGLLLPNASTPCERLDVLGAHTLLSSDIVTKPPIPIGTTKMARKKPESDSTSSSATPSSPQLSQTVTSAPQAVSAVAEISPTTEPEIATASSEQTSGLNADLLFSLVNQYRIANGLPAFETNDTVCAIAEERAPEVAGEVASGTMHAGFYALNLPYRATENIISMRTEQEAFNWWINDPIHRKAILSDAEYSCIACSGDSCSEVFTSFTPK